MRSLRAGFTLVELLITVAIVGILAAIAIPGFAAFVAKSRQTEAKLGLEAIHALELGFYAENGTYGSLSEIGFVSEGNGRYGYVISADSFISPILKIDTGSGDINPLSAVNPDGPPGFFRFGDPGPSPDPEKGKGPTLGYGTGNPHFDEASFEAVAIGVISSAPPSNDLDIWSIDNYKSLANLNPGF